MLEMPLRVGLFGTSPTALGVAHQVHATDGMQIAWQAEADLQNLEDLEDLLKETPIDVFVEASANLTLSAESSLLAIANNAHVVLTDPRTDVAAGLSLQAEAYQRGAIVTSDAGTAHGTLATMMQEAHIMGFQTVQAGQISPKSGSSKLHYEMAALANGFGLLPPDGGMTGPQINTLDEVITAFDLDAYGDTPRVDFVQGPRPHGGLYLIVKPKKDLPAAQAAHLRACQLGDGPYYLLLRDQPLGYFETPKAILAASAGQAILAPGLPTCEVYAQAPTDLETGTTLPPHLPATLRPLNPDLVPHALLQSGTAIIKNIPAGTLLTFDHVTLPDAPLTHLWVAQQEITINQTSEDAGAS